MRHRLIRMGHPEVTTGRALPDPDIHDLSKPLKMDSHHTSSHSRCVLIEGTPL
jgi:hypothetical protein